MGSEKPTLSKLESQDEFIDRHIGPSEADIAGMLANLGISSLAALVENVVPESIMTSTPLNTGSPMTEQAVLALLQDYAAKNRNLTSMIGMGYYGTYTPGVILRNVLENPSWYTAYTPYQAEVSQGRLEALLNYQQMVVDLTGMELANASMLDEATAAAEAMALLMRINRKSKSNVFLVDEGCHPQTIAVVRTRARPLGIDVKVCDTATAIDQESCFGLLIQYPATRGDVVDLRGVVETAHAKNVLVTVATDLLSLVLLAPPGEMGADVVVGSSQRFGVPMGYGGPHAAFFATRDAFKRSMPGRIIGVSVDSAGRPGLRMALQTREQHIRREKATSNICTAQVLLAVIAAFYVSYHGPQGLRTIAGRVHRMAGILVAGLSELGIEVETKHFFDTVTVLTRGQADAVIARALEAGINVRKIDDDRVGVSVDETTTRQHLQTLWQVWAPDASQYPDIDALDLNIESAIPKDLVRTSDFLTHPVFHLYHSETEMLRYLRSLAAKDIALDRAMIPLGSCTMKLNATTEMMPVTWPAFNELHPFAPVDQAEGYASLFSDLERMLCDVTGFDAVSLQPNAGSQGEYAGLLSIRKYHESRNDTRRDICLIPSSAHGTNPASAMMAGMQVIVVACDDEGNVDLDDLKAKSEKHSAQLSTLMITYPSTHGVFEESIREICQTIHDHGGQVYMDGANLNALLGVCRLAEIGADVSHMNLHKTFCIPHGGGGPGMGPIGVRAHLAPFLSDHPVVDGVNPAARDGQSIGPVSAAPWGSASILPISWAYMKMMGDRGLLRATQIAILNANYVAARLAPHYPIVYTGKNGRVAHECIIDLGPVKESCGITVDDVAKRLVDYGFHAPTMSWPVHDSMMIEPTESESKRELDGFCDAMIAIREEIASVERGEVDAENNLLTNAPHTHRLLVADKWDRPYSRRQAYFPLEGMRDDKYWPPVGRVDNVYGDRNLACTCPPLSAYMEVPE